MISIFNILPMKKYGELASKKISKVIDEFKHGVLHIGKSKKVVKSKKQAIVKGLSEARKRGSKVPAKQ